jgi:putative SOS response-associated peptidase YedK
MNNDPFGIRCQHEPASQFPTFGNCLQSRESKWMWVSCPVRECGHRAAVAFAPLAIRWGMNATTQMVRRKFRCSRCGNLGALTYSPSWNVALQSFQSYPQDRGLKLISDDAWLERMCNLYSLNSTREGIGRLFKVSHNRMGPVPSQLTMFPGRDAPVVRFADDGERELVTMSWGFVLLQPGKAPRRVTNTRDDKMTAPFWEQSVKLRRCLIPVTSYAEPDDGKPVNWHWFALNGDEPRPLFAFAGIWRRWKGAVKKDGPTVEIDTYSFVTTRPNALAEAIHHDRMPVLLGSVEQQDAWLENLNYNGKLLDRYPADKMREVQAGLDKEDLMQDVGL